MIKQATFYLVILFLFCKNTNVYWSVNISQLFFIEFFSVYWLLFQIWYFQIFWSAAVNQTIECYWNFFNYKGSTSVRYSSIIIKALKDLCTTIYCRILPWAWDLMIMRCFKNLRILWTIFLTKETIIKNSLLRASQRCCLEARDAFWSILKLLEFPATACILHSLNSSFGA